MNIFPKKINRSGDTIIEVMLAMTLLTSFLFIAWGITNRSTQIGINSRKRIEMVNAMKEQAEIIKAQYASGGYQVDDLISSIQATTLGLDENPCDSTGVTSSNIFYFTGSTAGIKKETSKKAQPDVNNSIWVQYKPAPGTDPEYYDFYIRSCWQTTGSSQNTDSSQFIVRLNKQVSSVIDTPDILDDTWTIAFEEQGRTGASVPSLDFNDFVMNVNVSETYVNIGSEKYLDKIVMRFTPKNVGHEVPHDGVGAVRFRIGLSLYPVVTQCWNGSNPNQNSFPIYVGSRPSITYQLIENGSVVNDSRHGFVDPNPALKDNEVYIFNDTKNTMNPDGSIRQEAVVTFTNFQQVAGNTLSARSYPSFPGISTVKPNHRRYRIGFLPYRDVGGGWDHYSHMANMPTDAFISTGAAYYGYTPTNNATLASNAGLFIPASNWQWPNEGESIVSRYPGYNTHHLAYLDDQCRHTNDAYPNYYDETPVSNGKMWWQL
jgi:hypothetical protein